jgi:hypothetical protein
VYSVSLDNAISIGISPSVSSKKSNQSERGMMGCTVEELELLKLTPCMLS